MCRSFSKLCTDVISSAEVNRKKGWEPHVVQAVVVPPVLGGALDAQPHVQAALADGPGDGVVQDEGDDQGHGRRRSKDGVGDVCAQMAPRQLVTTPPMHTL